MQKLLISGAVLGAFVLGPSGAEAASFVWTGLDPASGEWSRGANWAGGVAPSGSVDALEFGSLNSDECDFPYTAACYATENDIPALSVGELRLAGRQPYDLTGSGIQLGSGGISLNQGEIAGRNPDVALPLTLASDQTWHVNDGLFTVSGGMTGSAALTVELRDGLVLMRGTNEVGPTTLHEAGGHGSIELGDAATLNATSGNGVHVDGARLSGTGTVGSLTTSDAEISSFSSPFSGAANPFTLRVNGTTTLDTGTSVSGGIAYNGEPSRYTTISGTGDIDLASSSLSLQLGDPTLPFTCAPVAAEGRTYTLVATSGGNLTGTFAGIPDGSMFFPVQKDHYFAVPEPQYVVFCPRYPVRVDYTENSVEATVLDPVIRQPPGRTPTPPAAPQTGKRSAALAKCKSVGKKKARKKCRKRARRLPL